MKHQCCTFFALFSGSIPKPFKESRIFQLLSYSPRMTCKANHYIITCKPQFFTQVKQIIMDIECTWKWSANIVHDNVSEWFCMSLSIGNILQHLLQVGC